MRTPLFSIVTVTLNCAADAERTARSVLSQDFDDYEYIVKDGGSTDGTIDRLSALGFARIVSERDVGVYQAMNQAIGLCRGEYVCFMNAGDLFASTRALSIVAEHVRASSRTQFFYGDVYTCSPHPGLESSDPRASCRRLRYPAAIGRFWLYRRMICHQGWFVKRQTYLDLSGFDERYRISAAYEFLLRMLLVQRLASAHIPEVLAIYQGGGLSDSGDPRQRTERRAILRQFYRAPERWLYGSAYAVLRLVARKYFFRFVFPFLPRHVQDRVFGF